MSDIALRLRGRSAPPAVYLSLLLVAPVLYKFGIVATAAVGEPPSGQGPILLMAAVGAAVVAWLLTRRVREWDSLAKAWLLSAVLLWVYLVVVESTHGITTDAAAMFTPITLLLLWIKPPGRRDAWIAADVFAWSIVLTSAVALVLEVTGVIPSWYQILGGYFVDLAEYDRGSHWVTLAVALGMDGRWGGIMLDPNAVGPIGAFLSVYGFARSGWPRVVFVVIGLVIVVLADSRASYAAVAVGLLVLLLLPGWGVPLLKVTVGKAAAAVVGLLMGLRLVVDLVSNPAGTMTMTGRTGMWPDFLSLWDSAPWFGVGTRAITQAVLSGVLPEWSYHGHNQYVDTLVRYGVVGLLLSSLVLLILTALAVRGARRGRGLGAALIATLIVVTVTNLVLDWRYPSVPFAMLIVTALVSATVPRRESGSNPPP